MGEAALRRERQALRAILHPLAVLGLVVWLANDHLFKAQFGNALTGKLSDVAGLVVFPLLVAVALALWIRRPMPVAIGLTVAGYSAVNLFEWADAAAERLASLITPMRLTADPSDLLALPAVAVSVWVWRQVADDGLALRRSWAHLVFVAGITATLATSQPQWESELFSGTFVLTDDQRVVDIGLEVTLDGDVVDPALFSVRFNRSFTAFGSGAEPDPIVDPWDGRAISAALIETSAGLVVRYELQDLAAAPVEVRWELSVADVGRGGSLSGGAGEPLLIVDIPDDEFGPEPVFEWAPSRPAADDPEPLPRSVSEIRVQLARTTSPLYLAFAGTSDIDGPRIRAATTDSVIEVDTGRPMTVELPADCDVTGPCAVSIWVSAPTYWSDFVIELYGDDAAVIDVNVVEHRSVAVPLLATFGPFESEGYWKPSVVVNVAAISEAAPDPLRHVTDAITLDVDSRVLGEPQNLAEGDLVNDACCFVSGHTFLFNDAMIAASATSQRLGAEGASIDWEFDVEAQIWWVPELRGGPAEVDVTLSVDGS